MTNKSNHKNSSLSNWLFNVAPSLLNKYQIWLVPIIGVLLIFLLILSTYSLIPFNQTGPEFNFYYKDSHITIANLMSAWDGQWNLYLAEYWYSNGPDDIDPGNAKFGFFPLYPLTLRLLSPIFFGNYFAAGIITSTLAYITALILLHKITSVDLTKKIADYTILYYLIAPAGIFFVAIYSQSLFLLTSVSAIYATTKGRWWLASIMGMLAAMTKPQGFIIFVPLLIEYIQYARTIFPTTISSFIKTTKASFLSLLLIPLGTLTTLSIGYYYTNNIYIFQEASKYFGNQSFHLFNIPKILIIHAVNFLSIPQHGIFFSKLNIVAYLIFFLLLIPIYRKLKLSYFLYSLFLLLIPLASGSMAATLRSLSISFPHFMILAVIGTKHKYANYLIILIFIFLMTILSLRYVNWHWVS